MVVSSAMLCENDDLAVMKDRYERLLEQHNHQHLKNQELEDKMLNLIEKTEREKLQLSEEIDHLAATLSNATNNVQKLQDECAKYKKDCVLAVHLLQCQPSQYVSQKLHTLPLNLSQLTVGESDQERLLPKNEDHSTKKVLNVPSQGTFPPIAVFYDSEPPPMPTEPEEPPPLDPPSVQTAFVEQIRARPEYQCQMLRQCPKCGQSVAGIDAGTQTDLLPTTRSTGDLLSLASPFQPRKPKYFQNPKDDFPILDI